MLTLKNMQKKKKNSVITFKEKFSLLSNKKNKKNSMVAFKEKPSLLSNKENEKNSVIAFKEKFSSVSNKKSKKKFFFYTLQTQVLSPIGKRNFTKRIKKKKYRFSKRLKKLKIRYDLNKKRLFNLRRVISKLRRQNLLSYQYIKKLKLKISKLLNRKNSKHQFKKLDSYIFILRRLKFFRTKNKLKIKNYKIKKHLYEQYLAKSEKAKSWKQKNKKQKAKPYSGVLKILTIKRNIFITLSDIKGNVRASVSSGLLKVKGRKRQALHIVKATGQKIINLIFKHRMLRLFVFFRGRAYRKKKKTLTHVFSIVRKFKFLKINRPAPRCHNGCRSPKKRRK